MQRSPSVLALLSTCRQNVQLGSRAAISHTRHAAAICISLQRQTSHTACSRWQVYGRCLPIRRSLLEASSKSNALRLYSSAVQDEDDINVFYPGLVKRLESGDIQLIDVREPDELKEWGQIEQAINIPWGQVKEALDMAEDKFEAMYSRPKPSLGDENIVFSCRSGKRSLKALNTARAQGFNLARHFPGGWLEWAKENNLKSE